MHIQGQQLAIIMKNNMIGEILNASDNVDDQEKFGFTGSYFKIAPTVIDDYTKKKL